MHDVPKEKPTLKNEGFVATRHYSFLELVKGDLGAWLKLWESDWNAKKPIPIKSALKLIWNYAGLRATLLYRLSFELKRRKIPVLPGIVFRLNITLHGFDIPSTVPIGPGIYMPHPVGIVITAERIGSNLTLISSITIGMRNEAKFPIIGDNVFIGAGARVLGGITIGDNVKIGANSVVIKDVAPNCTVVGIPARVIEEQL